MNVSGEFTVNAPRDVVYKTLRDPSSFVRFVDGVSDLKEIDPTHYAAMFETRVAYLKFKFNVTVALERRFISVFVICINAARGIRAAISKKLLTSASKASLPEASSAWC